MRLTRPQEGTLLALLTAHGTTFAENHPEHAENIARLTREIEQAVVDAQGAGKKRATWLRQNIKRLPQK